MVNEKVEKITKSIEDIINDNFILGFGLALAESNRTCDNPVGMKEALDSADLKYQDFVDVGITEYDLEILRKAYDL